MLPCYCVWKPTEVSEVVQLLMNATFMHTKVRRFATQRWECWEVSRRWASTPEETKVERGQPRTFRALKNDLQWATYLYCCVQTNRLRLREARTRASCPQMDWLCGVKYDAAFFGFTKYQLNWHICHYCPVFPQIRAGSVSTFEKRDSFVFLFILGLEHNDNRMCPHTLKYETKYCFHLITNAFG